MKNRQFRGDRLYKLTKIVVILLTVYFAFNAISAYSRLDRVRQYRSECDNWKSDYTQCLRLMHGTVSNVEGIVRTNTYLAVGLPIVFFGGTILYQYLLPKRKS